MIDTVKKTIEERQTKNGNTSGTTINCIMEECGVGYSELKEILNQLFKEKFIRIRLGINGKLIFLFRAKKRTQV